MADPKHLEKLKEGVEAWNKWRIENRMRAPDLKGANLYKADLRNANLGGTMLSESYLRQADLTRANLAQTDLYRAYLYEANLSEADLSGANLNQADFNEADLSYANLAFADLYKANLSGATLTGAKLKGAILFRAILNGAAIGEVDFTETLFKLSALGDLDFSSARNLQLAIHRGRSSIGIDTIYKSKGEIPVEFLLGAGVPRNLIAAIPALVRIQSGYKSCFISYSSKDEGFVGKLHARMQAEEISVMRAPEGLKAGRRFPEQIKDAINKCDKLVFVLSDASIDSEHVKDEIRMALKASSADEVIFPISLSIDQQKLDNWQLIHEQADIAAKIREIHRIDFSRWEDCDSFEAAFARLLKDLRKGEGIKP